jgi:arginase family enzyme
VDETRVREIWERRESAGAAASPVWLRPGEPTFAGAPAATRAEELHNAAAAILGIPWQRASSAAGTAGGPTAIRRAAAAYASVLGGGTLPELDRDLVPADRLRVVDYGDAPLQGGTAGAMARAAHEKLIDVIAAGGVPLVLGGEDLVSIPVLQVISGRLSGKLGIIAFDDRFALVRDADEAGGGQWRQAFDLGVVEPEAFVQIGIRAAGGSAADAAVAAALGHPWYTAADVDELGIDAVAQEALQASTRGTEAVYVAVDVRVLEPGGCGEGEPGGLTVRELLRALRITARAPLAGLAVTGVAGDTDGAAIAARAVLEVLGGLALQFPEGQGSDDALHRTRRQ